MKIRCRECNARFHYGQNSGICPTCMEYNPWAGDGKAPGYSKAGRFWKWAAGTAVAASLVLSPFIYGAWVEREAEREQYRAELQKEKEGDLVQEIPQGQPVRAGEYYLMPGTGFWLPQILTMGMVESGERVLVIPAAVSANEEDPKERAVNLALESQGRSLDAYDISSQARECWPGLEGRILDYGYYMEPVQKENYILFAVREGFAADEPGGEDGTDAGRAFVVEWAMDTVSLCVTESIREPDTYDSMATRIYKTRIDMAADGEEADDAFLSLAQPQVHMAKAGEAYDYYNARLSVKSVACRKELEGFPVPEGKKLAVASIFRKSDTWPSSPGFQGYTAMKDREDRVFANLEDWELGYRLDDRLSDLWQ